MAYFLPSTTNQWNDALIAINISANTNTDSDFTLSDFKSIFFWEWFSTVLGAHYAGNSFCCGLSTSLVKKYFDKQMIRPFVVLFLLGGLQGVIGWLMVVSGLNDSTFM